MARWFFQEKEREKKKVQKSTKMIEKNTRSSHVIISCHLIDRILDRFTPEIDL